MRLDHILAPLPSANPLAATFPTRRRILTDAAIARGTFTNRLADGNTPNTPPVFTGTLLTELTSRLWDRMLELAAQGIQNELPTLSQFVSAAHATGYYLRAPRQPDASFTLRTIMPANVDFGWPDDLEDLLDANVWREITNTAGRLYNDDGTTYIFHTRPLRTPVRLQGTFPGTSTPTIPLTWRDIEAMRNSQASEPDQDPEPTDPDF